VIPRLRNETASPGPAAWELWASDLSPFALKVDALCDYAGLAHRWLPAEGGRLEGLRAMRRVRRLVAGRIPLTFPRMTGLDEFPLVPFLLGPDGENLYDSSAIGEWLDDAWARLAADVRPILGPLAAPLGRRFAARQVRRLPYLFSVAPEAAGFGERFTLADASAYGQLGMNLSDPSAEAWIRREAPRLREWLGRIAEADFSTSRPDGPLGLDEALRPLLQEICASFVPLMQQNCDAWRRRRAAGETLFNEKAFDAGRALYDGELAGHAFRGVAKTFQVRVWLSLRREWDALSASDRARLEALLPARHGLSRDGLHVAHHGMR
jgi:hypothetical protein